MKQKSLCLLLISTFVLSGCGINMSASEEDDSTKLCRIEVFSAQGEKLVKTIEDQDTINELSETYNWKTADNLSEDLIPEYKLVIYQEKTLLHKQDSEEERDYEIIETIVTFQGSSFVKEVVYGTAIKNMKIPEDALTSYYVMPDNVISDFQELIRR